MHYSRYYFGIYVHLFHLQLNLMNFTVLIVKHLQSLMQFFIRTEITTDTTSKHFFLLHSLVEKKKTCIFITGWLIYFFIICLYYYYCSTVILVYLFILEKSVSFSNYLALFLFMT